MLNSTKMSPIKSLKIKIYQPSAHFRIPFTYQRRHTYPLPPYSTVIGFLCNMLGIFRQDHDLFIKLKKSGLAVAGCFDSKNTEYIWFRNLSKKSHETYYGSEKIRVKNGAVQHIGGQSPMKIDVLENFRVIIHLLNEDEQFLDTLLENLKDPVNRLEVMHLGRAEDWLVMEKLKIIELTESSQDGDFGHFFWIPQEVYYPEEVKSEFKFEKADGLFFNLPVFATIDGYEQTLNRNAPRSFCTMRTKLNDGAIKDMNYLFDNEERLPVFSADISKSI